MSDRFPSFRAVLRWPRRSTAGNRGESCAIDAAFDSQQCHTKTTASASPRLCRRTLPPLFHRVRTRNGQ